VVLGVAGGLDGREAAAVSSCHSSASSPIPTSSSRWAVRWRSSPDASRAAFTAASSTPARSPSSFALARRWRW
jgi:hypothetical protein